MQHDARPARRGEIIAEAHLETRFGAVEIHILVADAEQVTESDFHQRLKRHHPDSGREDAEQIGKIVDREHEQHAAHYRQPHLGHETGHERERPLAVAPMELAADARELLLERLAIFAREHARVLEQLVPRARAIAVAVDLAFDFGDAIANSLARADIVERSYHLKIAAATNAMIIRMPNSMCSCPERSSARFSFFASVVLRTIRI